MKDFKIIIKSTVDGETNELITYGDVVEEFGATSVNYYDEQTKSPTRIVVGCDSVNIIREGELSSVLTFEEGKSLEAVLRTEYGEIPLVVETTSIRKFINEKIVKVVLDYITDFNGERSKFSISLYAEKINLNKVEA